MKQSSFLYEHEADKFLQSLTDTRKEVRDFHVISDRIIQMEYLDNSSFLPIDFKTNVFLASFTTCWSRTKLYEWLDIAQIHVLYVDTDSVIFSDLDKQITKRLPIGNYLG